MRITIVGGAGAMGSWFGRFFSDLGWKVIIYDISPNSAQIASKLKVEYDPDPRSAISKADVVMISVPIHLTLEVIKKLAGYVRPGCLLMDVTSIKRAPVEAMIQYASPEVEVLGTHPMFPPSVPSIKNQTIIFTPVGKGSWFHTMYKLFRGAGARVEVLSPRQHDELMSICQGLIHFMLISLAHTLSKLDFHPDQNRSYLSFSSKLILDMMGRLLAQNPELFAGIQCYLDMDRIRESFIQSCLQISQLSSQRDFEGLKNMISRLKAITDADAAFNRTQKLMEMYANLD